MFFQKQLDVIQVRQVVQNKYSVTINSITEQSIYNGQKNTGFYKWKSTASILKVTVEAIYPLRI